MAKTKLDFDQTITSLKGADRVRKRPAVIFGSDGIEGVSIPSLRYFQMPLMKRVRGTAKRSI